jgi:hypothetical protein
MYFETLVFLIIFYLICGQFVVGVGYVEACCVPLFLTTRNTKNTKKVNIVYQECQEGERVLLFHTCNYMHGRMQRIAFISAHINTLIH